MQDFIERQTKELYTLMMDAREEPMCSDFDCFSKAKIFLLSFQRGVLEEIEKKLPETSSHYCLFTSCCFDGGKEAAFRHVRSLLSKMKQ